ncbi:MAG: preprotein translocase subunit SecE [Acidobacteriota bacterium]
MEEKKNIFKKLKNFLMEVKGELKKVTWPNKKEIVGTTIVVVIAVIFFGFFLFFFDVIFSVIVAKIKTILG